MAARTSPCGPVPASLETAWGCCSPSALPPPLSRCPRHPLAAKRPEGEKRLCAWGGGGPGRHPRGRPQAQECGKTLRPLEPGCPGLCRAALSRPCPCLPHQSLLGVLPAPLRALPAFNDPSQCLNAVALELKPSPVSWSRLLSLQYWLPLGKSKNQGEWRIFFPTPSVGSSDPSAIPTGVTWVGDFSWGLSFHLVECRA